MTAVQERPHNDISKSEPDVDNYEDDDFEKELESFIQKEEAKEKEEEEEEVLKQLEEEKRRLESHEREDGDGEEGDEKGTWDEETSEKEAPPSDPEHVTDEPFERPPSAGGEETDRESEPEDYNFTEDQRRAMDELLQQRQETGFTDEDPPEYDVRARLKELNAELAEEPDPEDNRPSKVVFKENVVDFVAPAPDYPTDDDEHSQSQEAKAAQGKSTSSTGGDAAEVSSSQSTPSSSPSPSSTSSNTDSGRDERFVVERDGKFTVVSEKDMTPTEKALHLGVEPASEQEKKPQVKKSKPDAAHSSPSPSPPPQPRPATANAQMQGRRNYRPASSPTHRPYSAAPPSGTQNYSENYRSPYGMSPEMKEESFKRARLREQQRQEEERRKKDEKERAQRDSEEAFRAWLRCKREEARMQKQQEEEMRSQSGQQDKKSNIEQDYSVLESYTPIYQSKENEEAFKAWLRTKKVQVRQDKLLKKRQDQELREGYYYHSREECDRAFREWLRRKATEDKKSHAVERKKAKIHRMLARRSKRAMAITKALQQAQSFRFVDYYGYRY